MSKLTVIAQITAKKDAIKQLEAELVKLVAPTRQENGCIEYRLHRDNLDPAVFIFYETWENPDCLEQHLNSRHYKDYITAVNGMIAEKTVHRMTGIG